MLSDLELEVCLSENLLPGVERPIAIPGKREAASGGRKARRKSLQIGPGGLPERRTHRLLPPCPGVCEHMNSGNCLRTRF